MSPVANGYSDIHVAIPFNLGTYNVCFTSKRVNMEPRLNTTEYNPTFTAVLTPWLERAMNHARSDTRGPRLSYTTDTQPAESTVISR